MSVYSRKFVRNLVASLFLVFAFGDVQAQTLFDPVSRAFKLDALNSSFYPFDFYAPIRESYAFQTPWNAIGNIVDSNHLKGYCSAFLTSMDTIMTAEHCLSYCKNIKSDDGRTSERKCIIIDPAKPQIENFELNYFSNLYDGNRPDGKSGYWDEKIKVVGIIRSGGAFSRDTWYSDESKLKWDQIHQDWIELKLEHPVTNRNIQPLKIAELSSEKVFSAQKDSSLPVFISSYPNFRGVHGFNNMMLRLSGPCTLLSVVKSVLQLGCRVDNGSSGAPIMVLEESGAIKVIGVVSSSPAGVSNISMGPRIFPESPHPKIVGTLSEQFRLISRSLTGFESNQGMYSCTFLHSPR